MKYTEYREAAERHAATLEANQNASQFIGHLTRAIFVKLSYDFAVNLPRNICTAEEVKTGLHAIQSGTVHAIGALLQWDISAAREFAASILEDVNDHAAAAMVRKLTADEKTATPTTAVTYSRDGKKAESAVFYCIPIFQPSGTHKSSRGSGMDECEIIPGLRAKEHRAAKRFSTAFPELIVRECGVATTCFKAGKVLSK